MSDKDVSFGSKLLGCKPSTQPLIIEIMEDSWTTVTNESEAIFIKLQEIEKKNSSSPMLRIFDFYEGLWFLGLGLIVPAVIQYYNEQGLNNTDFALLLVGFACFISGIIVFVYKINSLKQKEIPLTALFGELKARIDSLRTQIDIIQKRFHDQIQTTT